MLLHVFERSFLRMLDILCFILKHFILPVQYLFASHAGRDKSKIYALIAFTGSSSPWPLMAESAPSSLYGLVDMGRSVSSALLPLP
jgi:hypothetical protein